MGFEYGEQVDSSGNITHPGSWGVKSSPKESIPKMIENFRVLMDNGSSASNNYADTQDGINLSTAKSYADTQDGINLSTAKSYADSRDAVTLNSAKVYADSQDGINLNSAKTYADARVAGIVNSAPATLDTLKELADALGDDPNFATTMTTLIGTKAPLASPSFTGTVVLPQDTSIGTTTATELGYLHGVTSNIQTQLGLLAPKASPIFSGSVKATGKVGFGTSDFSGSNYSLSVDQGIGILTTGDSFASNRGFWITKDYTTYNGFNWQLGSDYSANMYVGNGSDWINRMTVLSNGYVGIGASLPQATLEIKRNGTGSPGTSGTSQNGSLRLSTSNITSVMDFGTYAGGGLWIQGTDSTNLASNTPISLNPNGGGVGIGCIPGSVDTLAINSSGNPQLVLGDPGATVGNKRMILTFDKTNNYGLIQAVHEGNSYRPILLNPNGGIVGLGTNTPDHALTIGNVTSIPGAQIPKLKFSAVANDNANANLLMNWAGVNLAGIGTVGLNGFRFGSCDGNGAWVGSEARLGLNTNPQATLHSTGTTILGHTGVAWGSISPGQFTIAHDNITDRLWFYLVRSDGVQRKGYIQLTA